MIQHANINYSKNPLISVSQPGPKYCFRNNLYEAHRKRDLINIYNESFDSSTLAINDRLDMLDSHNARFSAASPDSRIASCSCVPASTYAFRNYEHDCFQQCQKSNPCQCFPEVNTPQPDHYSSISSLHGKCYHPLYASLSLAASALLFQPRVTESQRFLTLACPVDPQTRVIAAPASNALSRPDTRASDYLFSMLALPTQPAEEKCGIACQGQNPKMKNQTSTCLQEYMDRGPLLPIDPGHPAQSYAGRLVEGLLLPREVGVGRPNHTGTVSVVLGLGGSLCGNLEAR